MGALHLEKLLNEPSANVVGIFDADPEQGKVLTHKYRVKSFASTEELFFEAEAVFIASPTISHSLWQSKRWNRAYTSLSRSPCVKRGSLRENWCV